MNDTKQGILHLSRFK